MEVQLASPAAASRLVGEEKALLLALRCSPGAASAGARPVGPVQAAHMWFSLPPFKFVVVDFLKDNAKNNVTL